MEKEEKAQKRRHRGSQGNRVSRAREYSTGWNASAAFLAQSQALTWKSKNHLVHWRVRDIRKQRAHVKSALLRRPGVDPLSFLLPMLSHLAY